MPMLQWKNLLFLSPSEGIARRRRRPEEVHLCARRCFPRRFDVGGGPRLARSLLIRARAPMTHGGHFRLIPPLRGVYHLHATLLRIPPSRRAAGDPVRSSFYLFIFSTLVERRFRTASASPRLRNPFGARGHRGQVLGKQRRQRVPVKR